jgi:hypothetical protein
MGVPGEVVGRFCVAATGTAGTGTVVVGVADVSGERMLPSAVTHRENSGDMSGPCLGSVGEGDRAMMQDRAKLETGDIRNTIAEPSRGVRLGERVRKS